ncbi:MAG: Lrp/AsnC family transcriptional regulator [Magnetococcales bacterium]|nr:Lrp/AsnC family transcriptional regulator [Magnetococcales bacterium]
MITIDATSRRIINNLQTGFPLSSSPFFAAAQRLGLEESLLIKKVQSLLSTGVLTRFGPLFNAERMGGGLTLAAMALSEHEFDSVAEVVNAMPEVAHNYARDHAMNMWFVLATEKPDEIQQVIDRIEKKTGHKVFNMPKQEEYRLGFKILLDDDGGIDTVALNSDDNGKDPDNGCFSERGPNQEERAVIAATQDGLPVTHRPYDAVAESIGILPAEVINHLENMLTFGWIRRIGLVPNHYKLGLAGNGMSVWNLPDNKIRQRGKEIGALGYVSHCYRRPRNLPQWPFNLFVMVHGADRTIVKQRVEQISQLLGEDDLGHGILFSSKILKKTGLRLKTI